MLTLYYLENSQSIRILWLLEELKQPYQLELFQRNPETMLASESYKQLSPTGTAPCIKDDQVVLSESAAIMDYLLDKSGSDFLRPEAGHARRQDYLFWFHFAQGSLQPLLTSKLVFDTLERKSPLPVRPLIRLVLNKARAVFMAPRIQTYFKLIENHLQQNPWFSGDHFSAADIAMYYPLATARVRAGLDDRYPAIQRFLQQAEQRSAYKAALERSGGFNPLA